MVYLLECLQKTAPPVLIFAEKKQDVDSIHEYLLLKGVEAVAIHGGKGKHRPLGYGLFISQAFTYISLHQRFFAMFTDQEERSKAVEAFKNLKKDVLVATDVASKGLDFPQIQHVINYDMPDDIENYGMTFCFKRVLEV